ncbi:FecR family protein [Asticcacaulis sp. AND118]|uniref:FecR family protein n=1 Tax=Asticcacaulis sp. AND118 TaxID=2840468 RepID=UPI001D0001C1|nr:FecR domain-containing protein [Asticcacaulis sp. AND118]UDF05431.1 FecR domain-containing protein [Asticcacaulis sp. AND118]
MSVRETAAEIEEAATRWLWRRESGDWDADSDAALDDWLRVSTARQGAFLRAEAAFMTLDRLNWDAEQATPKTPRALPVMSRRWLIGGGLAAAASVTGAFVMLKGQSYVSPVREIRSIALADGSAATLNAATALRVDMGGEVRRVDLQRGEAFFQVHPDHARPFVVAAGKLRVRAVGTAFSVIHDGDQARVVVTEGVVETWWSDRPEARTRVAAGEGIEARRSEAIVKTALNDGGAERSVAWRLGRIDLNGETLDQAVAQFNRYNEIQLVVADPALRGERLYGVFDARDPLAFARTTGIVLGAPVRRSDGEIRIGWATPR